MSTTIIVVEVGILLLMLLVSAIFSAIETAFTSLSDVEIEQLRHHNSRSSRAVVAFTNTEQGLKKLLTLVLLLNNLANITAASLLTTLTIQLFGHSWVLLSSVLLTVFILIFAEVTPKQIAFSYNIRICLLSVRFIQLLNLILKPLVNLINWLTGRLSQLLLPAVKRKNQNLDELFHMVNLSAARGLVGDYAHSMLHNVLRFNDMQVNQLMTHRIDIFSLPEESSVAEALEYSQFQSYSLVPIYRKDPEKIVAVVDSHQVLLARYQQAEQLQLKELGKEVLFVPELLKVYQLYRLMQHNQTKMAVAIDEYGGLAGLVSREDVIGAVFSSFGDEDEDGIKAVDDGWLLEGTLAIQQFENYFNLPPLLKPSDSSFSTIGGYLLNLIASMPEPGQIIEQPEGRYRIVELRKNRIYQLHFQPCRAADWLDEQDLTLT